MIKWLIGGLVVYLLLARKGSPDADTAVIYGDEFTPGVPGPGRLLGDVDGDGVVTPSDAIWVSEYVNGIRHLTEEEMWAADVNRDGVVTAVDALLIKRHLAGLDMLPVVRISG